MTAFFFSFFLFDPQKPKHKEVKRNEKWEEKYCLTVGISDPLIAPHDYADIGKSVKFSSAWDMNWLETQFEFSTLHLRSHRSSKTQGQLAGAR